MFTLPGMPPELLALLSKNTGAPAGAPAPAPMNSVPGAPGAFGPPAPIQMGPGGVNLRPPSPAAPPIQNAPGTNVPMGSPSPDAMAATFGRSKPPQSSDDPGITGMPALPTPPDMSKSPVPGISSQYQADLAKRAAFKPPNPVDYKPNWKERLKGGVLGGLVGGLSRNAEEGGAFGASLTNRRFNQAQGEYARGTSSLDKQLEAERGGFGIAEAASKVPQQDFTNKFEIAKEQRAQKTAESNAQYKSDFNEIRQQIADGKHDEAERRINELAEKNKNNLDLQKQILDLRRDALDAKIAGQGKQKPATKGQFAGVEAKKAAALQKAKTQYDKETDLASNDPDARKQADQNFKQSQQDAQDAYEAEIAALGGTPEHQDASTWNGKGAKPSTQPAAAKPKVQVGEVHTIKGKQMKITKIHPDGTFDADPVGN